MLGHLVWWVAHSILEEVTEQKEMHFQGIEDIRSLVLSWMGKEGRLEWEQKRNFQLLPGTHLLRPLGAAKAWI